MLSLLLVAPAVILALALFVALWFIARAIPRPRTVLPSEKTYQTSTLDSGVVTRQLACWHDRWVSERQAALSAGRDHDAGSIEPAEVRMSVIVPAYNEETRILPALEEMVACLDSTLGRGASCKEKKEKQSKRRQGYNQPPEEHSGYEILIVDDGSRDKTVDIVLEYSKRANLHDIIRVIRLARNRGKGGAVTHGLRHARGEYALFADADGASKFHDVSKLLSAARAVSIAQRSVAVGSRAHMVGSDAVVQRSKLRNFLMRCFHIFLTKLTPPATSRVRDTQCGFKLFSRAALPHIVPYMHSEGWIFDIEMLMLAESAPAAPIVVSGGEDGEAGSREWTVVGSSPGIKVAEVPIEWHEVEGSKLNVVKDSIDMAVGLIVLRATWLLGIYERRNLA